MKLFLNVCALVLVGGFAAGTLPAFADAAADAARDEARAQADNNRAQEQTSKGHPFRAGRAAKKAERASERAAKEQAKYNKEAGNSNQGK